MYSGDPNEYHAELLMPLVSMTVVNDTNPADKLAIIDFLISAGADVNAVAAKRRSNVLHLFYMDVTRPDPEYAVSVTSKFLSAGTDVNGVDSLGAVPLIYAVSSLKLSTPELTPLFLLLLNAGADPSRTDSFGENARSYAERFPWRHDLLPLLEG